jgi:hypothetical protein
MSMQRYVCRPYDLCPSSLDADGTQLIFGPTRRRISTKTLRLRRHCSRCWARTVTARMVLLVVARTPQRQRRSSKNLAKTLACKYGLFVLVRVDSPIRAQCKSMLIQLKRSVFNTFTTYSLVLVCIGLYWFVLSSIRSMYWSVLSFSI